MNTRLNKNKPVNQFVNSVIAMSQELQWLLSQTKVKRGQS